MAYEFVSNSSVTFALVQDKATGREVIRIEVPTYALHKPTKERAVKPEKVRRNGKQVETGWYNVPKSDSFVSETKKLRNSEDASKVPISIQLQVYRSLSDEVRHQLYLKATADGLKVHPVDVKGEPDSEIEATDNGSETVTRL